MKSLICFDFIYLFDSHLLNALDFILSSYTVRLDTSVKTLRIYNPPTDWFHLVFVVEGANTDITVFQDKVQQTATPTESDGQFSPGSGTTIIGKFNTYYGSVTVDELAMWNRALSGVEVAQLYDMVSE